MNDLSYEQNIIIDYLAIDRDVNRPIFHGWNDTNRLCLSFSDIMQAISHLEENKLIITSIDPEAGLVAKLMT